MSNSSQMNLTFQPAEIADAEQLTALCRETFLEDLRRRGIESCGGPPGFDSVPFQREVIARTDMTYLGIWLDGELIGGLFVHDQGNGVFELTRIFVAPPHQGKGIGAASIRHIEASFPARKWKLDTPGDHALNHKFYERHGYRMTSESTPEEPGGFFLRFYEKLME